MPKLMSIQLKPLLQFVFDAEATPDPDCAGCQAQLHAYIDETLGGHDPGRRYPAIAAHLAACESCQDTYVELLTLLTLVRDDQLVAPPTTPTFDLSFLETATASRPAAWQTVVTAAQQHVQTLREQIGVALDAGGLRLTAWPAAASYTYARPVPARHANQTTRATGVTVQLPGPDDRTAIELSMQSEAAETMSVLLQLRGSRGNVRVTLRDAEGRLLESRSVGPNEAAAFARLSPGTYRLQLRQGDAIWELPLQVEAGDASPGTHAG